MIKNRMKWPSVMLCVGLCILATNIYALTYQIKSQVVAVGTTATKCPTAPLVGRKYIQIQNVGAVIAYVGSSTVTADEAATGGTQVLPYGVWREKYDHTVDVYTIVATGTCNVAIEEGK